MPFAFFLFFFFFFLSWSETEEVEVVTVSSDLETTSDFCEGGKGYPGCGAGGLSSVTVTLTNSMLAEV